MATASTQGEQLSTAADQKTEGAREELPRVLGRYVLLKRIARGGMGEVFLAATMGIEGAERPVVVKIIRRDHAKDPSFIARFLDEARVQSQLQHSGVAQVIDAAIDDGTGEPYAVMEYVEGRSLGDLRARAVQTGRAIGWADAASIATLIAEALGHVHDRCDSAGRALAIVHRDLSPQNVMVSFEGDVKLIDFGTARGQNRRCHTVAGVVFAKPGYVAPEVANGDSGDARVDLYALGVMLWELCAGRRFLQGDANVHMAAVARNGKNPPPIATGIGAPNELDTIIARLTAFDRDTRYAGGRAAARDLAKLLAAAPALSNGERGIRARTAELVQVLFQGEPAKSRHEFARLGAAAREIRKNLPTPKMSAAAAVSARAERDDEAGLLPGTRYRLVREMGRGSSSIVYEAEHVDLARRVALKVLAPDHSRSEEFAARFRREARALSKLSHEGLVKVHDFGEASDGRLFCVMERLDGETYEAFLARDQQHDWRHALGIAKKVLSALEVAHAAGVVHRDIKPANVFLTEGSGVKILDFGLARSPEDLGGASFASERIGFTLFGTPEYMAPEQAAMGPVDARTDLYALGCAMYEAITGRLPFTGPSAVAILDAKIKGSPERPRDRAPANGIPRAVDEVVMRALARHPSVRFQTAAEMSQAVDEALALPGRRRAGRRAAGLAAVAAVMAFAGVLLVGQAKELRAVVPWLKARAASAAMVAANRAPAGVSNTDAPSEAPITAPLAAADLPVEDPAVTWDQGEDGDMVDDTIPLPAEGQTIAMADIHVDAEVVPAVAPVVVTKAHPKRRAKAPAPAAKAPAARVAAAAPHAPAHAQTAQPASEPPAAATPLLDRTTPKGEKAAKPRHKRKARVAKAK